MEAILLETFLVVCETKNFTTASQILFATQPTITGRIRALEDYLGFELFIRRKGKKTLTLTSRGKEFIPIASRIIKLYEDIESFKNTSYNSLTISTIASYATPVVANICKKMNRDYGTNIKILTYQTREAYELVLKKEIDMAFVSQEIPTAGIEIQPLFSQKYYLVTATDSNSSSNFKSINLKKLDYSKEIFLNWDAHFLKWHNQFFPHPKLEVDSIQLLIEFLKDTGYWAIVQECNIPVLLNTINLKIYQLPILPPTRKCFILTNQFPDKELILVKNKFITVCKEYILQQFNALNPLF
ncbi:LysR family transcriptional regulator [Streptococcus agalactiae]